MVGQPILAIAKAWMHTGITVRTRAYRDRRKKKTEFRQLWIVRINAICRNNGINYSRFINGLKKANIEMDRKQLSELAIHDEAAFLALIEKAKKAQAA